MKSFFDNYPELKEGDLIEVEGYGQFRTASIVYPPVGTILQLVQGTDGSLYVECGSQGLRNGYGLVYKLVESVKPIRGVARFLKERGL